jgi:hypothetical protein
MSRRKNVHFKLLSIALRKARLCSLTAVGVDFGGDPGQALVIVCSPPPLLALRRASKMAAGAHGSSRQLQDDVDAFSKEELARRPEVRLINRYMRWFFFSLWPCLV